MINPVDIPFNEEHYIIVDSSHGLCKSMKLSYIFLCLGHIATVCHTLQKTGEETIGYIVIMKIPTT